MIIETTSSGKAIKVILCRQDCNLLRFVLASGSPQSTAAAELRQYLLDEISAFDCAPARWWLKWARSDEVRGKIGPVPELLAEAMTRPQLREEATRLIHDVSRRLVAMLQSHRPADATPAQMAEYKERHG